MIITTLIIAIPIAAILLATLILSARTTINRIDEDTTDWWDEQ